MRDAMDGRDHVQVAITGETGDGRPAEAEIQDEELPGFSRETP